MSAREELHALLATLDWLNWDHGAGDDERTEAVLAWISRRLESIATSGATCGAGITTEQAAEFGLPLVAHYPADPRGAPGCDGCAGASDYDAAIRDTLAAVREALGVSA